MNELKIELPNGDFLVAEINDMHPAQICIVVRDADNQWVQDLALAEAVVDHEGFIVPNKFNLLLWEDEGDECYTHQKFVNRYIVK